MSFTSFHYGGFLLLILALYWGCGDKRAQNILLLGASYLFYGWVHPWWCWLMLGVTALHYACALGIGRYPHLSRQLLFLSMAGSLAVLGAFKYFDFFTMGLHDALAMLGIEMPP